MACTKPGVQYLPAFNELSPLVPLCDQVYPPSSFGVSYKIKQFLDYVGTLVLDLLQRVSLTTKAPIVRSHINKVVHSDVDGWGVLEYVSKKRVPCLGRLDLDITSTILELCVICGMLLQTFLTASKKLD